MYYIYIIYIIYDIYIYNYLYYIYYIYFIYNIMYIYYIHNIYIIYIYNIYKLYKCILYIYVYVIMYTPQDTSATDHCRGAKRQVGALQIAWQGGRWWIDLRMDSYHVIRWHPTGLQVA